jgi:RNA polymerase sigma-70 factor, ECF subfamily
MISSTSIPYARNHADIIRAQKIKSGNKAAFSDLFNSYYKPLCEYAFRFCDGDTNAVEDLVQDVFVRIWERRDIWNPQIAVRAYLYRSVHNQAISNIRKKQYETQMKDSVEMTAVATDLSPYELINNKELDLAIKSAIDILPERRREIFVLRLLHDMSYREIAEVLGISVNTVDTQLRRALHLLRNQLRHLQPSVEAA